MVFCRVAGRKLSQGVKSSPLSNLLSLSGGLGAVCQPAGEVCAGSCAVWRPTTVSITLVFALASQVPASALHTLPAYVFSLQHMPRAKSTQVSLQGRGFGPNPSIISRRSPVRPKEFFALLAHSGVPRWQESLHCSKLLIEMPSKGEEGETIELSARTP